MKTALFIVALLITGLSSQVFARDAQEIYSKSCTYCHATGAAKAPKTNDATAWKPRLEKGMPTLINNAKNGIGAMPAKGMCTDCSDAEFQALIELMSKAK